MIEGERKIDLSLTPEEALGYPFVDVWGFQCALAWMTFSEDGQSSHAERSMKWEQDKLGVTDDMLHEAVKKAGGSISKNGHYPIPDEIKAKLAEKVL